jgi:alginate O-acetyltransferase complex protein AlgI
MQIVPLGLSYYTLKTMHYAIEGWKNTLPSHTFSQYLTYQFFLPTLMAGPINRFQEFHRSLCRRRWDSVLFSSGCERVLYGYVKVVCLSNYLVSTKLLPLIGTHTMEGTAPRAYLDCLAYGLNLYFQFSGYSDVAIGFALMLGLRVGENFNFPFLARSINEFWQRWHISLSLWCKDYVFMPVFSFGRSPLGAILFSMLGIALWHEFSLRYVAWGIYHALGIATWHLFQRIKPACLKESLDGFRGRVVTTGSVLLTLNFVILSFALTKEPDLGAAFSLYATLFGVG